MVEKITQIEYGSKHVAAKGQNFQSRTMRNAIPETSRIY